MVVRTALQNIPILSSLPDIPNMYASNPNFSFIVDLIVLCVMFGAILAPLGRRVLKSKKSGKQFGAVLGIIFGASAAFALNAAGVPLFKYWLTILFLGVVLSVIFYKILRALGASMGFAGFICLALAWILLDLAFVEGGLGSQSVQTGFGAASMLFVVLAAIAMIAWFLIKGFGGGGGIGGGPLSQWWNEDIKGGWASGGLKGLASGILRGPKRIWSGWPRPSEDEARLRHEEERGNAVGTASAQEDAANAETERAAADASEGARTVQNAGDEGARIAEEFKTALNALLTMIVTLLGKTTAITKEDLDKLYAEIIAVQKKYAAFNSPLNKLRAGFGKIQSFEKKINASITAHNTLKTAVDSWDLSQLKARIDSLSSQEKAALMPKYNDLNKKITNLKAIIVSVEATITRMQTEHIPFLAQVKLQTEYAALSQYFARITTSLTAAVGYIKPVIEAYARNPDTPPQNRAKETLDNVKPLFEQILTVDIIKLKASWETLAATQTARYDQIKSDISTWTRAYAKVKKQGIAVITSSITTINTLVVEAEQREQGAAVRQQAVQQGAATPLAEVIADIDAIRKKLAVMIKDAMSLANAVRNTEKFTKGDKKLKTAARDAIDVAVANAKFAAVEEKEVEKIIQNVTMTLESIRHNIKGLKDASVPNDNPELLQLTALESNLRSFLETEGKISNLLTNTEKVLVAQVTAAVSESKTKTVTGANVKAVLVAYIQDLQSNLEFLKTETNSLQSLGSYLLKNRPQLPAKRKPLV